MEQCACDIDPNTEDCLDMNTDITAAYPTLPYSYYATYSNLPPKYEARDKQFFTSVYQGDNCYDMIGEAGLRDSDVRIYHRLGYTNGTQECNNTEP
jgi:hypothetical protein